VVWVTASCATAGSATHGTNPKEVDMIEVRRTGEGDPLEFEVVVRQGQGESRHPVTMAQQTCDRLTGGKHTSERCLEAAFRFLLDREPNGVDPQPFRRDGDLALLPGIRGGAAALPGAVLIPGTRRHRWSRGRECLHRWLT
jgi:hypothetical protein